MCNQTNNQTGQSIIEFILVMGLLIIPGTFVGVNLFKSLWNKTECAFQNFKKARIVMIQSGKPTSVDGIKVKPLEDLDQNKGPLETSDLLREVSQLWEQLSSH